MLLRSDLKMLCLLAGVVFLACACTPASKQSTPMPSLNTLPEPDIDKKESPGSLYQPSKANYLFADNRASRVGDIVLVKIKEQSSAESTVTTEADRETNTNLGVGSFLGKEKFNFLGAVGEVGQSPIFQANSNTGFAGDGETSRESTVQATVAARVVRTLPNGLLQVEGGRKVRVNGENQIVVVRGLIRSRDIGPENTISSDYLADAHIEYYGKGILADKQRPGWLTRILDNVWPF